jgi:hypothetical protein
VTDPLVSRYFMTISEAVHLVLQAGLFAKSGEIFVLDMGEPVRILDLAENMIRMAGLKPYDDIKIEFIGLRDGEKLHEEILLEDEAASTTLTLSYTIFDKYPVITRHVEFSNTGTSGVRITRALSCCLDLPDQDYEMMQFDGAWARERIPTVRKLGNGMTSIRSTPNPFRSSCFSWRDVRRRRFRASSCRTFLGWGQNVTTTDSSPAAFASERSLSITWRCPRWTPSKKPVETTAI